MKNVFSRVTSAENKGSIEISAVLSELPAGFGNLRDVVPNDRPEADHAQDDEERVDYGVDEAHSRLL